MRSTTIGSIRLLAVAAFCVFGCLASFDPTNIPGIFLAFRIGYAVVGLGCVAGVMTLIAKAARKWQPELCSAAFGRLR